jgi:hypothetical protein
LFERLERNVGIGWRQLFGIIDYYNSHGSGVQCVFQPIVIMDSRPS